MSTRTRIVAMLAAMLAVFGAAAPAPAAVSHQQIEGSGSSWSYNAMNVWIAATSASGIKVVFTPVGSATGRKDFGNGTTDYAVTDIGYQGKDPLTGDYDQPCKLGSSGTSECRQFAYLPIVAGGTAFPYHIEKAGKLVRNLRLSGDTLAKIFTRQITNWSDPQITKDNNGVALPAIPIIPVAHGEGSGSTAQFTTFLAKQYPQYWQPFAGGSGFTEYYPTKSGIIKQNGSDQIINFITGSAGNGTIGYDEYSYALAKSYPVAKVENSAGYFTLPNQYNVAVALRHAVINTDKTSPNYLLQNLDKVYVATEPQVYPLSSYSYMIIPTAANDARMTTAKRQSLADFIYYSVCQGQRSMGPIGYSPLPLNLVQASFDQVGTLKQADPGVVLDNRNVTTCDNPTFVKGDLTRNHLAEVAPVPAACDHIGQGPCTDTVDHGLSNTPTSNTSSGSGNASSGQGGTGTGGQRSTAGPVGRTGPAANGHQALSGAGGSQQDGTVGSGGTDPNATDGGGAQVTSATATIPQYRPLGLTKVLAPLTAIEFMLVIFAPPVVAVVLRRRRSAS